MVRHTVRLRSGIQPVRWAGGWLVLLAAVAVLAAGCRRKQDPLEEEIPPWLREPTTVTERTIQPDWFKAELHRIFDRTSRVRIFRGYWPTERILLASEDSPEKIAALVSRLEIDGPTIDGPGRVCRCVPDLYLEFETPSGKEVLSPVCARRLRLGTLKDGIKWPDPSLTRPALAAFKGWIEDHGVDFACCGERSQRADGGHP